LIDEADTFLRESDELRGVLNSGHNRAQAFVVRTVGEAHEPRRFATWAPKAIALIGRLPATLESRALHIELQRLGDGEHVEPLRGDRLAHLEPLRRKGWRWASDNAARLSTTDPPMPPTLRGRTADNWRALIAIADVAGGDWPMKARRAAELLSAGRSERTAGVMLLEDIRRMFAERETDRLTSGEIVAALAEMDARPWPEWTRGKPITARGVAKLLDPFKIRPTTIRLPSGTTPKGYTREGFADAFGRYLPDVSATPQQVNDFNELPRTENATRRDPVADLNSANPLKRNDCCGVADSEGN
jgi:putative DNA primase/helicase